MHSVLGILYSVFGFPFIHSSAGSNNVLTSGWESQILNPREKPSTSPCDVDSDSDSDADSEGVTNPLAMWLLSCADVKRYLYVRAKNDNRHTTADEPLPIRWQRFSTRFHPEHTAERPSTFNQRTPNTPPPISPPLDWFQCSLRNAACSPLIWDCTFRKKGSEFSPLYSI